MPVPSDDTTFRVIEMRLFQLDARHRFSYRQTSRAYPSGGAAHIVAHDNLGDDRMTR